jgi:alkylation response protein AidB-like acyl-CoA dehydrogenase
VQLLGGHGYVKDHPVEKFYREARTLSLLYGGRDGAALDAEALGVAAWGLTERGGTS